MSKKLVVYFSASGATAKLAKTLASAVSADLHEIIPKEKYTSADLDWTNKISRSSVEMNDKNYRPAIKNKVENMEQYDVIYIGFPIWWYVAPSIIHTFVESYDFSGKTLIPFATSGGSGMGRTVEVLQSLCPAANWESGRMLNHVSDAALETWLGGIL